jgi:hypothetical protein
MRLDARKGLVTALAAGGALAAAAGCAQADTGAQGTAAGSPGVLSGNLVQVPVQLPVNACGNTVNAVGLLNPASGNACANDSQGAGTGTGAVDNAGAAATGAAEGSPGVASGLTVQLPVHAPVNVSGNSVGVVSVLNPTTGNTAVNGSPAAPAPTLPRHTVTPEPRTQVANPPAPQIEHAHTLPAQATLAHTGSDGIGWMAAGSAASLLGGTVLYRRFRPGRR